MVRIRSIRKETSSTRERNANTHLTSIRGESSLQYATEKGENSAQVSYQEVSGAPVETRSPLGYHAGSITILFLNLSKMIGTGVYSTPASILKSTGSVGLSLIYWFIGFLIAASGFSIYLEFASYFPNRSGSEAVYLEQSYPRPRYFLPVVFAIQAVLLSFSSSNSIVLAQYLFRISGHDPTPWQQKGIAIAGFTLAFLFAAFSTRGSYLISNAIGMIKLITLIFIAITGLVVLGGNVDRVSDPKTNFYNSFSTFPGASASVYGYVNAMYKIVFSYTGYENAFNVVNEVKEPFADTQKNPVITIRNSGGLALLIVAILYILANVAYFSAIPKEELVKSKQVAASLFFQHVFGTSGAVKGLNFLIAMSAFGNLLSVMLGKSRMIRECGRQGILPFPKFWVDTRPFGTPLGPYFVQWFLTIIMILAPPAGDAFNFIVDLAVYPSAVFSFLMAVGLYLVRYQRKNMGVPEAEKRHRFRAWHVAIIFSILVNVYMLVLPWYPPPSGAKGGDVGFWYGTYIVTGIGVLALCAGYYAFWVELIPAWNGQRVRHEKLVLDGGEVTHKLVRVPLGELESWDKKHDAQGAKVSVMSCSSDEQVSWSEKQHQLPK